MIRVMRNHDLTNKITMTMTKTKTFREHLQRTIFETFETYDQSVKKIRPDQHNDRDKDKDKDTDKDKDV